MANRWRKWSGAPAGAIVGVVVFAAAAAGVFARFEQQTLDARLAIRGEEPLDPHIVVVEVDDGTLDTLGKWPLPRAFHAALIDAVRAHGARAVGFDILFLDPTDEDNDGALARAARKCACVVFPAQLTPLSDGSVKIEPPIPALASAAASSAHVQIDNGVDGVFRSVPLSLDSAGRSFPALAVAVARVGGAPAHGPGRGDRAWVDYRTVSSLHIHTVPFADVLLAQQALETGQKPDIDLDRLFTGALVLVGQTSKSIGDRGPVPLFDDRPLVLVHANLLDNLMNDRVLEEPPAWLVFVLTLWLASTVGLCATRLRALPGSALAVLATAGLWALATWAYAYAVWLPLASPTAGALGALVVGTVLNLAMRDSEEKKLRAAFERYVAPHILDKILEHPEDVDIRGHSRTISLLFSDIKGYTTLSNTLPAEAIVELLCTYLDTMVDILLKSEGTVDKIMGDGIMAFFGDPVPQADHALRCVRAALEMQNATARLGETWVQRGLQPLQVRIGVATGEVFVGSIGSRHHLEYTAIGRPVNLASRLEGKAPPGGVLVSNETYELVKDDVEARLVRGLDLKGYVGGLDAWLITGLAGAAPLSSPADQRSTPRRAFFSDVILTHEGKDIAARSSDISPGGMFIVCDEVPPVGARVTVRALLASARPTQWAVQMDAVVSHLQKEGAGLMFTTVFADDRAAIHALLEGVLGHDAFEENRVVEGGGRLTYTIEGGDHG